MKKHFFKLLLTFLIIFSLGVGLLLRPVFLDKDTLYVEICSRPTNIRYTIVILSEGKLIITKYKMGLINEIITTQEKNLSDEEQGELQNLLNAFRSENLRRWRPVTTTAPCLITIRCHGMIYQMSGGDGYTRVYGPSSSVAPELVELTLKISPTIIVLDKYWTLHT